MMEFISSPAFLGIIFMSGGTCLFLLLTFISWFVGRPRRFFCVCLTYADNQLQQISRVMWIFSWILLVSGVLIVIHTRDFTLPLWLTAVSVLGYVFIFWLVPKIFLLITLLSIFIYKILAAVWRWAIKGDTLFSKRNFQT